MLKNCAFKIAVAAVLIASIGSIASAQEQPAAGGIGIQPKTVGETAGGSDTKAESGSGTTDAAATPDAPDEATMIQKVSLVFGYNAIGKMSFDMKRQGLELDMDQVLKGAKMAADGEDLGMDREEVSRLVTSLQGVMREKQTKLVAEAAEKNKADGEAFLAENEKKEGVKKLENGVQYEILTQGEGDTPKATDKVKLHYHGTTTDGKVFDSSVDKGKPITHSASGFVKGFNAAVQAMPVGSKWRVTIPSDLAYGMSGPLGPNRTLNFEIELLEIVPAADSK
jgi:FKBP-type peptidyl-prolyl cis-trans isomerase